MAINNRRGNNRKVSKTLKDYIIPLFIVFIISIFILNKIFSKSSEETTNTNTNSQSLELTLSGSESESFLVEQNGDKNKLLTKGTLSKNEKLQVANGSTNISLLDGGYMNLNMLGELKYNDTGYFSLFSSDLWVNSNSSFDIEMRYAKIKTSSGSIFSLRQNDISSSIYVVSGNVDVKNIAGNSAILQKGETLSIPRDKANDKEFNLGLEKKQIDDYIKEDDWFITNGGNSYLTFIENNSDTGSLNGTGNLSNIANSGSSNNLSNYISFDNINDEMQFDTDTLNIDGKIIMEGIYKIDVNGFPASIDFNNKTFSIKDFKLTGVSNDLVYKAYGESGNILDKGIITLYYSGNKTLSGDNTITTNISTNEVNAGNAKVENYPLTNSPLYKIISPKQNPLITTDNLVKLEGTVPYGTVEKIIINDFRLQKFSAYGTYWSYFANTQFGNLKEGLNVYKIQYYGKSNSLLYENTFSIVKKEKEPISTGSTLETNTNSQVNNSFVSEN